MITAEDFSNEEEITFEKSTVYPDLFQARSRPITLITGDKEKPSNFPFFKDSATFNSLQQKANVQTISSGEATILSQSNVLLQLKKAKIDETGERINVGPSIFSPQMSVRNNESKKITEEENLYTPNLTQEFLLNDYLNGIKAENSTNNPYIYSNKKYHPFSYLTGTKAGFKKGLLSVPSPTLLKSDLWISRPDLSKSSILKGLEISDQQGLILIDKEIGNRFKGIIKDMIGQLVKATFGHKISLSIKLFEPKSFLQNLTDYWLLLPLFLPKAARETSPIERMKLIISFAISGLYIPSKNLKPFNPLIGETFQGEFANEEKTTVFLEQISNYPNVSRFLVQDTLFKLYGFSDISLKTESLGNKITVCLRGTNCFEVKSSEKVYYTLPEVKVLNATSTNGRSTYYSSSMVVCDVTNNLKAIIAFGKNKECIHEINGCIMEYQFEKDYKFDYDKEKQFGRGFKEKKGFKILSKITGSWLKEVRFDGRKYWDIDNDHPCWVRPVKKCLPSDGRFREDLIWLFHSFNSGKTDKEKLEYENLAQDWKYLLEQVQREEREIKAKSNKKWKKEKKK